MKRGRAWILAVCLAGACSQIEDIVGELHPGHPPPPVTPPVSPPASDCTSTAYVHRQIIAPKCLVCHDATPVAAPPDLREPQLRERLLTTASELCGARPLVTVSGGRVTGFFFDKLAGAVPGCGMQMPFGAVPPLDESEVQCLRAWLGGS